MACKKCIAGIFADCEKFERKLNIYLRVDFIANGSTKKENSIADESLTEDEIDAQQNQENFFEGQDFQPQIIGQHKIAVNHIQDPIDDVAALTLFIQKDTIENVEDLSPPSSFRGENSEFFENTMYTSDTFQSLLEVFQNYWVETKSPSFLPLTFTQYSELILRASSVIRILSRSAKKDPRHLKGLVMPIFSTAQMKRKKTLDYRLNDEVGHWAVLTINFENMIISFYDSLGKSNSFMNHDALKEFGISILTEIFGEPRQNIEFIFKDSQLQCANECGVSSMINITLILTGYAELIPNITYQPDFIQDCRKLHFKTMSHQSSFRF